MADLSVMNLCCTVKHEKLACFLKLQHFGIVNHNVQVRQDVRKTSPNDSFIFFSKEGVFSPGTVCGRWFFGWLLNRFPQNTDGGRVSAQTRIISPGDASRNLFSRS